MKATDFFLLDSIGTVHSLSDYLGKWLVIFFYPKDDTPGCTKEACSFRDAHSELLKKGIAVVGVSKDSIKSHGKFAEKFSLPFPLLSDPTHEMIEAYGAWGEKKFMGRTFDGILRKTVIINPEGEVVKRYEEVTPEGHAEEVMGDIEELISKS